MSTSTAQPASEKKNLTGFLLGLAVVIVLCFVTRYFYNIVKPMTLPGGIPGKVLEYPIWAAVIGLIFNWIFKATNVHERLTPGFKTELFLKVGLILLGGKVSFKVLVTAAGGAVIQGIIMVTCVYFFSWWLAGKFGLPDTLRAVMSTAVSICGVSAAIASAGAVLAKKEEITYVTALVIVTALPLMVIAPLLARAMNLPDAVAGAWFGGNVDTTAAVVGAGTIYGETAETIASIVKQTQNALIGIVAFFLAYYFVAVVEGKGERPSMSIIWQRFPKFVLGFIIASLLFTFGFIHKEGLSPYALIQNVKAWFFCAAFVCMGLELSVSEFKKMGWNPVIVYLIVTLFNTLLALGVSWLIFGWLFPVNL
ncbi:YeiH family protein [Chloroflexota bacterium]